MSVTNEHGHDFGRVMRRRMLENDAMSVFGPIQNIEKFSDNDLREIIAQSRARRPAHIVSHEPQEQPSVIPTLR